MKILHLNLKKKWFDMILSGEKMEEYREIKRHYLPLLLKNLPNTHLYDTIIAVLKHPQTIGINSACYGIAPRDYDAIEFRNGYSKTAPTMLVECKGITMDIGNPTWGAPAENVFIIKCGKVLKMKNCKQTSPIGEGEY